MADIMATLHYMLTAEIPRKAVIDGENLSALKQWIHALKKVCCFNWLQSVIDKNWQRLVKTDFSDENSFEEVLTGFVCISSHLIQGVLKLFRLAAFSICVYISIKNL